MTKYVALLRGIMPMNPNMRGEKLRGVFESLGYKDVQTVITSGNVIFSSASKNVRALETKIEKELLKQLRIKCPAYIRSKEALERMVLKNPFNGAEHSRSSYLIVSFLKKKPGEVYKKLDITAAKTPEFMRNIEKKYGKDVTTRTWKTVERILKKMSI
jgi:uncharacterized protein (DUF1697 family)